MYPLITRDPVTGGELVVTRLTSPQSGIVIEGTFTLGWIGKLTPEQLEFVGVLLRHRGNVQRAAAELGIAYNTARNRLEEIASALGGPAEPAPPRVSPTERREILNRLAAGEIDYEEAMRLLGYSKGE